MAEGGAGLLLLAALLLPTFAHSTAHAQTAAPVEEEVDTTRLDVERLPPEAIELTRDLYAHGVFIEAFMGVRGFIGGAGRLSRPGPFLHIGAGYEVARWLWVSVAAEGSLHKTEAPRPPGPAVFEVLSFLAEVRLQANIGARAALWLGGEFGITFVTSDVLTTYGLQEASEIGIVYGGQVGLDWHLRNRHHSIGLSGGARVHPGLEGLDGEIAIGVHGTLYLRYVF